MGERNCWVDVGTGDSAEQKDDNCDSRSKCERDDDESLESSDALG